MDERWLPLLPAEDTEAAREHVVRAELLRWKGGSWHYIRLTKKLSAELKQQFSAISRGFGSLKVEATVGTTTWKSSLFPDKKSGTYILLIKATVRKAEGLKAGKRFQATVRIL